MQSGVVTSGLVLYLDAGDTASYTPGSSTWTDMSSAGQSFTINPAAYKSTNAQYMDFNGSFGCAKRNPDTTYYNTDMTAIVWTRIKNSTAEWRTLFRGLSTGGDHNVIIQSGGWAIGMYDNVNGTGFNSTGYSQQSLPGYGTNQWNMLTWRWNNGASPYYSLSYNDTPGTARGTITSTNARFKSGICSIGAYNNGSQTDVNNASQYWGDIAVVMMYNRLLSDAEVLQNYNAYAPSRFGARTPSVVMGPNKIGFSDTNESFDTRSDSGAIISITTFSSSGTYTVPSGCTTLFVRVQGGGGGSAGYCESGGAGGYAETFIKVAPAGLTPGSSTIAVTVGGGGGGVGYYAAGGAGGTSSFGSYVSATGGRGANNDYSHTGGHGGYGSGLLQIAGGGGSGHANGHGYGGISKGGAAYFGGPAARRHSGNEFIGPGSPGAGAPGGITDGNTSGSNGNSGLVVVYAYA